VGRAIERIRGYVPAAIEVRRRRRYNCHLQDDPGWERRAEAAAELLGSSPLAGEADAPLRIADLGAGSERPRLVLEGKLREPFIYAPYDLHPQRPSTRRLDLSSNLPPEHYDVGFMLGLLEYLPGAAELPRRLRACCDAVIASYFPSDAPAQLSKSAHDSLGWRSHMTRAEAERAFQAAGYSLVASETVDEGNACLWFWSALL
jgi:hypothetical protein